ncbi:MAG: hypothetical protein ABUT20_53735 [Bacteroidota bacterium]
MNKNIWIFLRFIQRDLHHYSQLAKTFIINISVIYPLIFTLSFGLIIPTIVLKNPTPEASTAIVISSILWILFQIPIRLNLELLYDMIEPKFINYQISILSPRLVLLEKILFASLITFVHLMPFPFICKLLMGKMFLLQNIHWPSFVIIMFLSSLLYSIMTLFIICFVKNHLKMRNVIMRSMSPLMQLGGLFGISWFAIKKLSLLLALLALLNPFMYVTEGLRIATLPDGQYISFPLCVLALCLWNIFFFMLSCKYFKKKLDHI